MNTNFKNQAGVVIEDATASKKASKKKAELEETLTLTSDDFFMSLATYLPDPFVIIPINENAKGNCKICGIETNRTERKICPACLKENKTELYNKFKPIEV